MDDTIAAISTSLGVGAISIIRVSGSDAIEIVNKNFKGNNLEKVKTHTINYGYIVENDRIIDEVLVSVMREPKSFTKENIVEINCHGGIATTNKILQLLLEKGCRLAEPGEFTKRAFLNGRIDLIEAEGIIDIIHAKTEQSRNLALNQISGEVSSMINNLRKELIEIIANIEVNIDYPEYEDIEEMTNQKVISKIEEIGKKIKNIIKESENGKIIKEGIKTAIIGKPNVGKSSLLNNLIGENKAIVTEIEGTTRDIVEGTLNINGIVLNIIDTAGIRETSDIVEKIGVSKSLELIDQADLILFVLSNDQKITNEELSILEKLKKKNHIVIINKIDLENKIDISKIKLDNIVHMSLKNNKGIKELKNKIEEIFNLEKILTKDPTYLTSARSISLLKECLNIIEDIKKGILKNNPIDIIEIDIKKVWSLLGEITGDTYQEELLDQLFSQFCLGK